MVTMTAWGHDITPRLIDRESAFLAYASMADRSLRKLAEQLGIPDGTIFEWSRAERWAEKVAEEERQASLRPVRRVTGKCARARILRSQGGD